MDGLLLPAGSLIGGLIIGTGLLVRRWSRDKLEIAKDRAEENLMQLLIQQRNDALAEVTNLKNDLVSIAEENEDAIETIRDLTTKNEQMRSQLSMLTTLVRRLAAMNNAWINLDFLNQAPPAKFTSRDPKPPTEGTPVKSP